MDIESKANTAEILYTYYRISISFQISWVNFTITDFLYPFLPETDLIFRIFAIILGFKLWSFANFGGETSYDTS